MKHTETPWRVGSGTNPGAVVADEPVPEIGGSDAVEYYGGHLIAESIAPRNAEFIVRACNSHDQMVVALKVARDLINEDVIDGQYTTAAALIREALHAAGAK